MEIIELKPPQPWAKPRLLPAFDFQISGVLRIPKLAQRKLQSLDQVLNARKSRREFRVPLTFQQLGDLLWHSSRVRESRRLVGNTMWTSKPSPSGGGCHPIQLIVLRAPILKNVLLIYDPEHHVFGVHELPDSKFLRRCLREVEKCLKIHNGTVLWFVADLARSGTRYRNPESLAWRDSGALLATIGLVAESMGIECCGLGLHDIPSLRRFLKMDQSVIGVGGCIVGRAKHPSV
jgi:SagB-type dehydrogenase family enzyme